MPRNYRQPVDQPVLTGYTDDGLFLKNDYPGQPTHLGGHGFITNMDIPLLEWLISTFDIKRFIDLGCGGGGMVEAALERGISSIGIDGDPAIDPEYVIDFNLPDPDEMERLMADISTPSGKRLVFSTEFVEHVAEEYIPNFLPVFAQADVIFLSHGLPLQFGHHHVTLKDSQFWIDRIVPLGFTHHEELSSQARGAAELIYCKQSGLIFLRNQ